MRLERFYEFVDTGYADELVLRILKGDKFAENEFFRIFNPFLKKQLDMLNTGMLEEDLEEIIQNAWVRIFKKLSQYNFTNLKGWLYRILKHAMLDRKKYLENKGRDIRKSEITDTLISNPEEESLKKHVQEQLKSFKQTLNSRQVRILDMYLSGFSHQEIAEALNFTVGSSKWQVNDILNRFRKFYQK